MIDDLKPYPRTKDSGVPWLGDVPEGWKVQRLRHVAEMRVSTVDKHSKDDELPVRLCNYVDVYKNDHISPRLNLMHATATKEEIERFRLAVDDVLITKDSESWNDIGVPALVRESALDLISGYHLALLRPFRGRLLGGFLFRALQATGLQYQFHVEANGVTRYGLSHAAIRSIWLPLPSLTEQATIVRFLDQADRRIRRYIRAKQKLIKLLEEQKQALIHRAVTRGLDPNVRLKPSGIDWLGDIPEHWEVRRLKEISPGVTVGVVVNPSSYFADEGVPILLGNNIRPGRIRTETVRRITAESNRKLSKSQLHTGDVVVVRVGAPGVAAVVPPELDGCNCASVMIVRRGAVALPLWVEYLFNSSVMRNQIDMVKYGAAQKQFNIAHAVEFLGLLPPLEEQGEILRRTSEALHDIDAVTGATEREITFLREYRTRLIADVVTGKLDVREAAVRLPDEADDDEPEPLDDVEPEDATDGDTDTLADPAEQAEA